MPKRRKYEEFMRSFTDHSRLDITDLSYGALGSLNVYCAAAARLSGFENLTMPHFIGCMYNVVQTRMSLS